MTLPSKTSSLQAYHMLFYRKAVHPEFFGIRDRRRITHGEYAFESWLFSGGHSLLFHFEGLCVCEIVSDQVGNLPDRGLVTTFPCAGERDFEETISDRIEYIASVQTETLSDHLYLSTFREMREHANECDGLTTEWTDPNEQLPSLSIVDLQRYHDEVHVQGYHLRGDCSLVLRTQTIFRAMDEDEVKTEEAEVA